MQMLQTIQNFINSFSCIEKIYLVFFLYFMILLIKFLILCSWEIFKQLIPLNNILKRYSQKQAKQCWAVITGATDGIGLGFAEQLTKLGFDICLISRNQQKIDKTIENLKLYRPQIFKERKIIGIQFDFTESSNKQNFDKMLQKLYPLDIGILVNNVGTSFVQKYEEYTHKQVVDIMNVNCVSMAALTSALLPQLKKRINNNNSKCAIINLSSFAGQNPIPFVTLYSATKVFNTFLSEGIALEYPEIDVLSVRPMFVQSPLSRKTKQFNIPDRRQCAYACLKQLRWKEGFTNGYITHRILAQLTRVFVPKWLFKIISKKEGHKAMIDYHKSS